MEGVNPWNRVSRSHPSQHREQSLRALRCGSGLHYLVTRSKGYKANCEFQLSGRGFLSHFFFPMETHLAHHMSLTIIMAVVLNSAPLFADTFATGGNQFTLDFVNITGGAVVDDPSSSNLVRYGAVPSNYRMGKFEVSRAMINSYNASSGGPAITMENMTPYGGNGANRPATGVSWNEAARFVNWLNTSTGHSPAYKFTTDGANDNIALWTAGDVGYDPGNPFRNSNAFYFLPSEDEWYRAAFYNPSAGTYWDYATGSDSNPTGVASGTATGTAVYLQTLAAGPADITAAGGLSSFGTMGQSGNVFEWMESAATAPNDSSAKNRTIRGGYWYLDAFFLSAAAGRQGEAPTRQAFVFGFRVASVPAVLKASNIVKSGGSVSLDIESNIGNVDAYRSSDLIHFGATPIAADLAPGVGVLVDSAAPSEKAFYVLVPHGSPAP